MVLCDKLALGESSILIEDIVVRFRIEMVVLHAFILLFDFVFNNKSHITEWEREIFLEY